MKNIALFALLAASVCASRAPAAIFPGGVVNAAGFTPFGLPNADIARGSLFLVFGTDLGAAGLAQAAEFPLPLVLAGTSVQVSVAGRTVDCPVIFTTPGQIAALLPSRTRAGSGEIRVTFNGAVSNGMIRVTESAAGIFTQGQAGVGPASVQNVEGSADTPLNSVTASARPGQPVIIWATGLGAVAGDDAAGPLPAARPDGVGVRVLIDGRDAQVVDFGRSGCCAGLDQIVAVVPPDIRGCFVPLTVITEKNGVVIASNPVSMSINPQGGRCEDDEGVAPPELTLGDGPARVGIVGLSRGRGSLEIPGLGSGTSIADIASATFFEAPRRNLVAVTPPLLGTRPGACRTVSVIDTDDGDDDDDDGGFRSLDAGASMQLRGPTGPTTLEKFLDPIIYLAAATESTELNGAPQPGDGSLFVEPGTHVVSAPGGPDVGAFNVSENVPGLLDWTNSGQTVISRARPHTVSWTGGDPNDSAVIQGSSTGVTEVGTRVTVTFTCFARVSDGSFEIPQHVLGSLPASDTLIGNLASGTLSVGAQSRGKEFSAPGLDFGVMTYLLLEAQAGVRYE